MVYPALLPLIHTPRLPAVDWTDAPADLSGLVLLGERRNLVSARVTSRFKCSPTPFYSHYYTATCLSSQGLPGITDTFCWLCSRNVSVLPGDGHLRTETFRSAKKDVNKVVLTYICAFVGFLREIVISVHGYEQDKITYSSIQPKLSFVIRYIYIYTYRLGFTLL